MDKLNMKSMDITQENIKKIQALFPNAVTEVMKDGKTTLAVDFDVLKQELSESLIDDKEERYQFTWPDKKKSILLANTPISATLRPCKEESVDFDNTQNLYIEGDNLDVLKLLQETYLGKIKMIYIDPPYNTGNDFIYNDDFAVESEEWKVESGDYDNQGDRLVQNHDSNGRFHTDWLNMIYPRLRLAKDLLSSDGVIFISIDDNEVENLKKICNEIFGESNFVFNISWRRTDNQPNIGKIARVKEYIVCFCKDINLLQFGKLPLTDKAKNEYRYQDEKGLFRRAILLDKTRGRYSYPIQTKSGKILNGPWMKSEEEFKQLDVEGKVYWTSGGEEQPYGKIYLKDTQGQIPNDFWGIEYGTNQRASLEVEKLFSQRLFDFPKPVSLINTLLNIGTKTDSIILDFFSGSATTAHAVMQLNAEDGGNRKFIMVQLPEPCDEKSEAYKAGYKNICEIGKERIRRAGKRIAEEIYNRKYDISIDGVKVGSFAEAFENFIPKEEQVSEIKAKLKDLDIGFRVLKLDSSNMKDVFYRPNELTLVMLASLESNIKEDRTPFDLLFQVMLELGKPLSAKIEEKVIAGKNVYVVDENDLIACFDENITEEVVKTIAQMKPLYAVFRDNSFSSDTVAANFDQIFATYSPTTTRRVL